MSTRSGRGGHKEEIVKGKPSRGGFDKVWYPIGMELAIVLLGVCQFASTLCLYVLLTRWLNHKERDIKRLAEEKYHDWCDQREGGKQSKFADVLEASGAVIGSAAARSIMSTIYADKGHAGAAASKIADQLQAEQNPIMAILAGGKRGKGAAIQRLMEMLGSNHNGGSQSVSAPYEGRKHRE